VTARTFKEKGSHVVANVPLTRVGTAEDVAGTTLFLASRAGAYVNGALITPPSLFAFSSELWFTAATITLDGGMTAAYPRSRM